VPWWLQGIAVGTGAIGALAVLIRPDLGLSRLIARLSCTKKKLNDNRLEMMYYKAKGPATGAANNQREAIFQQLTS